MTVVHLTIHFSAQLQFTHMDKHSTMTMCTNSVAFLLFLLALFPLSAFASDYELNIDCGSDSNYTDKQGREWVGDGNYTQSGESMKVNNPSIKTNQVMSTLRVFSTGQKNCYSVPGVPRQQVLVRATFFYGNYDRKSSPPTFDLLLENNSWAVVKPYNQIRKSYEAIYVVKESTVDVCVAQTSAEHIPFMSALEIRSMSTDMYKDFNTDTAFLLMDRIFYADAPGLSVLDSSGRYWFSHVPTPPLYLINATRSTTPTGNLPEELLSHAIVTKSGEITIYFYSLPENSVPVYVTLYFSEINPTTIRRSMDVYVDNDRSTIIQVPPYGDVTSLTIENITANSSTTLSLVASTDSTRRPLLNAYEVFTVTTIVQTNGTTTLTSGTMKKTRPPVILGTNILAAFVGIFLWGAM